ncbi:MAG: hypothetical protein CMP63_06230 [Flavobacteriales bacterium]|nr:hypothetical protein [Flavobacteriales bacterium]|tara:strand:- start:16229 stop:16603 length:375 start_codon:yes stop_codon:yes gene_type:complete
MVKFELEYPVKSSVKVLYDALVDSSKLTEWFCDDITLYDNGKKMEFFWEGSGQIANIIGKKENQFIRFQWEDETEIYFEMKIQIDEITNDVALIITDFAEEDEVEESKMLWDNQIRDLFITLGA